MRRWVLAAGVVLAAPAAAQPSRYQIQTDKYQITDAERAACQGDAVALCGDMFPDEEALMGCMKTKRLQLTPVCRVTFEAGMRQRHIRF